MAPLPPRLRRRVQTRQIQRRSRRHDHPGDSEMRGTAQQCAEIVRIADAIQPDQQGWRWCLWQRRQQIIQRQCRRTQHLETDAFVMAGTGQLVQVRAFDHAIAEPMLDAPGQHRLQLGNARLQQVDLAQLLRTPGECGEAGIDPVQAHLAARALWPRFGFVRFRHLLPPPSHRRTRRCVGALLPRRVACLLAGFPLVFSHLGRIACCWSARIAASHTSTDRGSCRA